MLLLLLQVAKVACHVFQQLLQLGPNRWHDGEDLLLDRLANVPVLEVVEEVADRVQMVQILIGLAHSEYHVVQVVHQLEILMAE